MSRQALGQPELRAGYWNRTGYRPGPAELKVIRDDLDKVPSHFGTWEQAINLAWQMGAQEPLQSARYPRGDKHGFHGL